MKSVLCLRTITAFLMDGKRFHRGEAPLLLLSRPLLCALLRPDAISDGSSGALASIVLDRMLKLPRLALEPFVLLRFALASRGRGVTKRARRFVVLEGVEDRVLRPL